MSISSIVIEIKISLMARIQGHFTGIHYVDFLERTLSILLDDVPLNVHHIIGFQRDSPSAYFLCQV
jgi:hypothetical protein